MRAPVPTAEPGPAGLVRADRRAQTADSVVPALLATSLLMLVIATLRLTLDPYPHQVPMAALFAGVGLVLGALRAACRHRDVRAWVRHRADEVGLGLCLFVSVPLMVELVVTAAPLTGGGVMVFVLASGAALNDRRYSGFVTGTCLVQWFAVAAAHGLRDEWGPVTAMVVCAAVLAQVLNRVRCRAADSLAAAEVAILEAAVTDELTGLANRRGLLAAGAPLLPAAGPARPLACLYLDVDGLKATNDRLGHEAGDALVRATGVALGSVARPADVVARLGGDEFAVLLPGTTEQDAAGVRDRLLAELQQVGVQASVGLAVTVGTGSATVEELLAEADAAMYAVKTGRRAPGAAGARVAGPRRARSQAPAAPVPGWVDPTVAATADLRVLATAGAWLHLAIVPAHLLLLPLDQALVMSTVAVAVAVTLAGVSLLSRTSGLREWSRRRSDLVLCISLTLMAAQTVGYALVVAEPWAALTMVLPVVAAGGMLVSRRRAALLGCSMVAGWVAVALVLGVAQTWAWSGIAVLSAHGVAALLHVTHARTMARLTATQEQVRAAALTDELTGLPNRRGFLSRGRPMVELSLRRGEQASVLFLDLDGLKQINDEQGHAAGDRVLTTAADVLRRSQGPQDLCARLGGDEFTVLLHGCPPDEVPGRVAWLEAALAEHQVSASIGAAHAPRDATTLDGLVDHADRAMLVVKQGRRQPSPGPASSVPG